MATKKPVTSVPPDAEDVVIDDAIVRQGNVVLYRNDGKNADGTPNLKPLFSCDYSDKLCAMKVSAKMAYVMAEMDTQGVPHTALHIVREFREADEANRLTKIEYNFFNPADGSEGETFHSLPELFASEEAQA